MFAKKKIGRPKLQDHEKKQPLYDIALHIKINAEQKDAITQIARLHRRSISAYMRELIIKDMKEHEV